MTQELVTACVAIVKAVIPIWYDSERPFKTEADVHCLVGKVCDFLRLEDATRIKVEYNALINLCDEYSINTN